MPVSFSMAHTYIRAHLVKPGMTILIHGFKRVVTASQFDRFGSIDKQPLQIIVSDAHPEDLATAGMDAKGLHLGMLCGALVPVVQGVV